MLGITEAPPKAVKVVAWMDGRSVHTTELVDMESEEWILDVLL